jgi:hypothetical protein
MKGGFLDSLSSSLSSAWTSTKKASSDAYNSATGTPSSSSYIPTTTTSSTSMLPSGGRKRRTAKRGGYSASSSMNGLASTAGSFSGKTAQPQNWVGGRTKRRRHRHTKSCKHKRPRKH